MIEGFAQVVEELQGVFTVVSDLLFKDSGESLTGPSGPFAADEIGDLEQRLDHVLTARGEAGRKLFGSKRRQLFESHIVVFRPEVQDFPQRLGLFGGELKIKALDFVFVYASQGFEEDGDGAVGEHFRQSSSPGEGFGTEEVAFASGVSVSGTAARAAGQQGAKHWVFTARTRADCGLE